MTGLALNAGVRTDTGPVRSNNQDSVFASPRLVAVADGVGGSAAGEVASAAVIDQLILMDKCRLSEPLDRALGRAISSGNASVGFIAGCRPRMAGMSTTLTAIALGDDGYVIANVGDSRAYLLRDGVLTQITRDETYVQELIDSGSLDAAAARRHPHRSVVLNALDGHPDRSPTIAAREARIGDRLLLCSDGLSDLVDEAALMRALSDSTPEAGAKELLELALDAGGRDNVTVVVADVLAREHESTGWLPAA